MVNGRLPLDPDFLEEYHDTISYRLELMRTADHYVELTGLPQPDGKNCGERADWVGRRDAQHRHIDDINARRLFPLPVHGRQGYDFIKPHRYLSAAMCLGGLDNGELSRLSDVLERDLRDTVYKAKEVLERDPALSSKRRTFFEAFGQAGHMSPV